MKCEKLWFYLQKVQSSPNVGFVIEEGKFHRFTHSF